MARIDYFNDEHAPVANSIVPSVTAIVQNAEGELLMVHKTDNGFWALPGGGVDPGESVTDSVVREVLEETGISVAVERLSGVYTNPRHVMAYDDGEVRQQFSLCFVAKPTGGTLTTSGETSEVTWMRLDDLETIDVHPSMRLRIQHGLDPTRDSVYVG